MKNIIIPIICLGSLLSSCAPMSGDNVTTSLGYSISAKDVTLIAVSGVLAENPQYYDDFQAIALDLRNVTDSTTINEAYIRAQITKTVANKAKKHKQIILASFNLVLNYFENKAKESNFDEAKAAEVLSSICDGIEYALELHAISEGKVGK